MLDLGPGRHSQPLDCQTAGFYPCAMFSRIGADNFNIHIRCASVQGCLLPFPPGQLDWVAGIGNHADPSVQDVRCHSVSQAIPLALNFDRAQLSESLLDGINSDMCGADVPCQQLGQCRLSTSREPSEYVENRYIHCHGASRSSRSSVRALPGRERQCGRKTNLPTFSAILRYYSYSLRLIIARYSLAIMNPRN